METLRTLGAIILILRLKTPRSGLLSSSLYELIRFLYHQHHSKIFLVHSNVEFVHLNLFT